MKHIVISQRGLLIDVMPEETNDVVGELMVEELVKQMTVRELRQWCSDHGVERQRGDDKVTTARRAVSQRRDAVAEHLLMNKLSPAADADASRATGT